MNIAILLLNHGRGSGEVARQHTHYLLSQDHQIYFIQPQFGSGISEANDVEVKLHTDLLPVHENLPSAGKNQKAVSTMSFEEAVKYLPAYEDALEKIIHQVDIVIRHHANLSAIASYNAARRYSKPYVLFLHGTGIEPRHHGHYDDKIWQLIQSAIENANGLIVTAEYVRDHLVRNIIDIPTNRFIVLPCGIDLTEFHPDNTDGILEKYSLPETYVICPGALTFVKGPQNVVTATTYYANMATTIFIGDGEMREELEAKLGTKGRFLGFVPAEDKAKLINAATLLIAAPEKKEHFGIIYAEALAGGTPSVAYEGGGVSTFVTPDTGVLTERNTEKLGHAVNNLLNDTERYKMMRTMGSSEQRIIFQILCLGRNLKNGCYSSMKTNKVHYV